MFIDVIYGVCNCNYNLFTNLSWLGNRERAFRSSSQAAVCPLVYHSSRRLYTVLLIAKRQAGKLWIPIFIVFGLIWSEIKPKFSVSVVDVLSTWPLISDLKSMFPTARITRYGFKCISIFFIFVLIFFVMLPIFFLIPFCTFSIFRINLCRYSITLLFRTLLVSIFLIVNFLKSWD